MPVATRRMKARWPPRVEVELAPDEMDMVDEQYQYLILPNDLYWNYVCPFTPVADRSVVNKRSGSTRFYAGERAALDETFLRKLEWIKHADGRGGFEFNPRFFKRGPNASKGEFLVYERIPVAKGEAGAPGFRMDFSHYDNEHVTDPAKALDLLRSARADWDAHLSRIAFPSERLRLCLEVMYEDDVGGECPLLFAGRGTIKDVITFHASVDIRSINDPVRGWGHSFPNSQLGYWVGQFLSHAQDDMSMMISSCVTGQMGDIVRELLDAGADVTPFLEPLHCVPHRNFYLRCFLPGMNILQCMTEYEHWYSNETNGEYTFDSLNWIVAKLRKKAKTNRPTLRFEVGNRVECRVKPGNGSGSWAMGTIEKQWYREEGFPTEYYAPYQIELDNQKLIFAPSDANDTIRAVK